jgi:hypothetical protein
MTSHIRKDNTTLAELAHQGRKDSRTLKILSAVATIYLPASLIAVSKLAMFRGVEKLIFADNLQFQPRPVPAQRC